MVGNQSEEERKVLAIRHPQSIQGWSHEEDECEGLRIQPVPSVLLGQAREVQSLPRGHNRHFRQACG